MPAWIPRSMLRAVLQAVWNGRVVSGGSTLTMQVARLLEESGTGKVAGKLRQMRVALALERRLTKDQILTLYLHLAPFGGNLEGVRAATLAYFGKEPRRLTPAEAALLVAIPQSPGSPPPRPRRRPRRGRARPRAGAGRRRGPDRRRSGRGRAAPKPSPTARRPVPALAPHLADRVRAREPRAPPPPADPRRPPAGAARDAGGRGRGGPGRPAAGRHRRGRPPLGRDPRLGRVGRLSGRCAAGVRRHDHGAAVAPVRR